MAAGGWDISVIITVISLVLGSLFFFVFSGKAGKTDGKGKKVRRIVDPETATYTPEEVSTHNIASDAWIIVDGKVYDITDYIGQLHPSNS
jgi:Cytochrome b5-like Heme/Steroid binding domain